MIDGPMVLATVSPAGVEYEMAPWVRVYRHDLDPTADHHFDREGLFAIDCVHAAWLEPYLREHLLPFTEEFGRRSLKHAEEIATGEGFAAGLGRNATRDVESRLRPRRLSDLADRVNPSKRKKA